MKRILSFVLMILIGLSGNAFALSDAEVDSHSIENEVIDSEAIGDSETIVEESEENEISEEDLVEHAANPEIGDSSIEKSLAGTFVQVDCGNNVSLERGSSLEVKMKGTVFFTNVSSSDSNTVRIDSANSKSFYIYARTEGSAIVTVYGDDQSSLRINVTVTKEIIKFDKESVNMELGSQTGLYESSHVTASSIVSSDDSIVKPFDIKVSYGRTELMLAAFGAGEAIITVTGANGSTCEIPVTVKATRKIKCPEAINVLKNELFSIESGNYSSIDISDPSIIAIDYEEPWSGLVQFGAIKEGTATITYHYEAAVCERTETVKVTVKTPKIKTLQPADLTYYDNESRGYIEFEECTTPKYGIENSWEYKLISKVVIYGSCISGSYDNTSFVFDINSTGSAKVEITDVNGKKWIYNVQVLSSAKPYKKSTPKAYIKKVSTIYANTTRVKCTLKNVKKGDVFKLKIGKKVYKKKIKKNKKTYTFKLKIKAPKKFGTTVYASLKSKGKTRYFYEDENDFPIVYSCNKIKKGYTKKQVEYSKYWGYSNDRASTSNGWSYWYYGSSYIAFLNGRVNYWYDSNAI